LADPREQFPDFQFTSLNVESTWARANAGILPESTVEPATTQTPAAADRTYTVAYDRAGQVATLSKPGGVAITNTYDPQGNLTKQVGTGASVVTPDRA
jgi:YD repeat-containing protein